MSKKFDFKRIEFAIGNYVLQVLGVGIVVLGMGFLLKYSIEHELFTPNISILCGFGLATLAIIMGEYCRVHYKMWATPCIAGGIVLYYISFYAAFNLYQMISMPQAFSGFAVTTILAGLLALWHNSYFIAFFSVLGGYATPNIMHVELFNVPLLGSYLLILALGYIILSYAKKWYLLSYISLSCVMFFFGHTLFKDYSILQNILFLAATWTVYFLVPYLIIFIKRSKQEIFDPLIGIIASLFTSIGIFLSLSVDTQTLGILSRFFSYRSLFEWVTFLSGVVHAALLIPFYFNPKKSKYLFGMLYSLSVVYFFMAIAAHWHRYESVAALSVFALFLFYVSFVMHKPWMRIYPYAIWIFNGWRLCTLVNHGPLESIIFNQINGALFIVAGVFCGALYLCTRYQHQLTAQESIIEDIFKGIIATLPLYWMHTKLWHFPYYILGLLWYGLVLFIFGVIQQARLVRYISYVSAFLAIIYFGYWYCCKNILNPFWSLWINIIFISFVLVFLFAWCVLFYWWQRKDNEQAREYTTLEALLEFLTAFFIFAWIRANIILYFDVLKMNTAFFTKRFMSYSEKNDILVRTLFTDIILILFYGFYSLLLIITGLITKKRFIRYLGLSIAFMACAKLSLITINLPYPLFRIIVFLILGGVLIIASFFYQKMSKNGLKP